MEKTKNIISLLTLALLGMVLSCSSSSGGSDPVGGDPPANLGLSITELANSSQTLTYKSVNSPGTTFSIDAVRPHHVLFSISSSNTTAEDYTLGLRLSNSAAPSATELIAAPGAIVRSLDTTATNIYLSFHIDAPIFATGYDWTTINQSDDGDIGDATKLTDISANTILQPGTTYTLYGTKSDGTTGVQMITNFTTDAYPTDNGAYIFGLPPSQDSESNAIVYTLKTNEPFLWLAIFNDKTVGGTTTFDVDHTLADGTRSTFTGLVSTGIPLGDNFRIETDNRNFKGAVTDSNLSLYYVHIRQEWDLSSIAVIPFSISFNTQP